MICASRRWRPAARRRRSLRPKRKLAALLLVLVFVPDLLKRADKSAGKRESEQHQG